MTEKWQISLSLFLVFIFSGCSMKLVSNERSSYFSKSEFKNDLVGKIIIEAEPDGFFDTDEASILRGIKSEIKYAGKKLVESPDGPTLRFHFYKCVETGGYPTDSFGLNFLIHAGTFTLWPAGTYFSCKSTLEVIEKDALKPSAFYESEVKCQKGGQLFQYLFEMYVPYGWGVRELASRRLIEKYQSSSQKIEK